MLRLLFATPNRAGTTPARRFRPPARQREENRAEIGGSIGGKGLRPDLVLCSSAVRARETLDLVLKALGPPSPEVRYDEELYMAPPATLIARLRKHMADPAPPQHVMLVGHNPGFEEFARLLVGSGGADDRAPRRSSDVRPRRHRLRRHSWSAVEPAQTGSCILPPKHLA
jgi:phosphohistidine phosphatase